MDGVETRGDRRWRRLQRWALALGCALFSVAAAAREHAAHASDLAALGRTLFDDVALSADGRTGCRSCHDPAHAYADPHARSIGVFGRSGTRNAPSLVGIAHDDAFAWDGRRTRLEDVVMDPYTNPVELGLASTDEIVARLRKEPTMAARFAAVFGDDGEAVSAQHVGAALAAFVRSLTGAATAPARTSAADDAQARAVERGKALFDGAAGCHECHASSGAAPRFADGGYHHSSVGDITQAATLPALVQAVTAANLDAAQIGPRVLADADWSALGRFVLTRRPADIGAFRTPSLRNVAVTAPYMHDGSIATLTEAVDHEIYYRGLSTGRPINLSLAERQAIVAFLESLTDAEFAAAAHAD